MTTLHIEHAITGYDAWKAVFDQFAEVRRQSGVRGHRISRPVDDERYVLIDLDFATVAEAENFRTFLVTKVWSSPASSPALIGAPLARILESVEESAEEFAEAGQALGEHVG
ncbi:hypothetical protein [Longispora fulva]|uniref:Cyclase n=1 Tax=Longispora fulva TaxID=619741 RepID=A0A8J7GQT7_9ACTN|nr:hypothetical protein [Longispora fulva]MBG6141727.1 hypothetical protein [Longispora fulva]